MMKHSTTIFFVKYFYMKYGVIVFNTYTVPVPVYLPRWTDVPWKAPGRGTGTRFGQGQIFLYEVSQRVSI